MVIQKSRSGSYSEISGGLSSQVDASDRIVTGSPVTQPASMHAGEITAIKIVKSPAQLFHNAQLIHDQKKSKYAPVSTHGATSSKLIAQRRELTKQQLPICCFDGTPQAHELVGKAISPDVAVTFQDFLAFDGIGRILAITSPLSAAQCALLQQASVTPLTETNSSSPRQIERTERDCLIHFLSELSKLESFRCGRVEEHQMRQEAVTLWMQGNFHEERVAWFFRRAAASLSDAPAMQKLTKTLQIAVSRKTTPAQRNDNLYGRKFDSEFAHALIENPPPLVLATCRTIGKYLTSFFEKHFSVYSDGQTADIERAPGNEHSFDALGENRSAAAHRMHACHDFADILRKDPRAWYAMTPDIANFIASPSPQTFSSIFENINNGFDVCKLQHAAVKLSFLFRQTANWMGHADANFMRVLHAARANKPTPVANTMTTRDYGNRLATHPHNDFYPAFVRTKSWAHANVPADSEKDSAFNKTALTHGHTIVNGASGSANIMGVLGREIAQTNSAFSVASALLASMMFLVFDGGHSLNEIGGVHEMLNAPSRHLMAERIADYHLDYRDLATLLPPGDDAALVSEALDTALEKTIALFDSQSYFRSSGPVQLDRIL